jgi:kanamycin kinase
VTESEAPPELPPELVGLVGDGPVEVVWRNVLGAVTYRLDAGTPTDRHLKWCPAGRGVELSGEAARMEWAGRWIRVPRVLAVGSSAAGSWLLTETIPARSAVDRAGGHPPRVLVGAIARGLRRLHDTLPVEQCPFTWSIEDQLERAGHGADPTLRPPVADRLVVCHGDACAPNTLVDERGDFVAQVDLGDLGIADRWADIAEALWSIDHNWGAGHRPVFFDAYGIAPDPDRIAYYERVRELT